MSVLPVIPGFLGVNGARSGTPSMKYLRRPRSCSRTRVVNGTLQSVSSGCANGTPSPTSLGD